MKQRVKRGKVQYWDLRAGAFAQLGSILEADLSFMLVMIHGGREDYNFNGATSHDKVASMKFYFFRDQTLPMGP